LDKKADQLTKSIGFMQEGQLLAMICLLLAQEKYNLEKSQSTSLAPDVEAQLAETIRDLAGKISTLSENLEK
ncbi:MAG: hypothetical protein LBU87_02155, partial [Lactobacillales bacterium]|jgi:hypothetical protein|nr:hypothetical protein [Lactobacillales bacterium]